MKQSVADGNVSKLVEIIRDVGASRVHKDQALEKLQIIYHSHPAVSEGISDKAMDEDVFDWLLL